MDNHIKISSHLLPKINTENKSKFQNQTNQNDFPFNMNRKKKISFKELSIKKKLDNLYSSEQEVPKHSILKKINTITTPFNSKIKSQKFIFNKSNNKSKRKKSSNFHFQYLEKEENFIGKNIKRKSLNLKKLNDKYFTFLEEPTLFEEKVNKSSFYPIRKKKKNQTVKMKNILNNAYSDDNIKLFNITHLSNKSILELNDIKKDLKKTIIKLNDNNNVTKKKTYFEESPNEEKSEEENKNLYSYRMLNKVSKIFDSLDDDDDDNFIFNFYIDPNNKLIITIDILIFFFSIYHIIYLPLFLGYNIIYCRRDSFFNFTNILQLFIDIIYIVDCVLSFFTASYNYNDVLKTDLKIISKEYLTSYFLIDLLSAIPFKTLFIIFDKKCNYESYLTTPLYQNNIYYFLVSLQLLKSLKVINKNHLFELIKNYLTQYEHFNNYFGLYISVLIFISCLHIVACIFIFIGKNQIENWILNFGFENYDFYNLYFISIYYIITTVTTVGYGDLSCVTPIEKIFGLFMEIVGIIAYSFALSSISNYVKEKSDKSEEFFQKCQILEDIKINYPNFSDDLYKRIYRYLKADVFDDKKDNKLILNSLPISLKNDLVYNMYKPIIDNFFFFKNFNNIDFIVSVILSFKPIIALRNDVLMKHGDYVEDIIFVKYGRLSLDLPILIENNIQNNSTFSNVNSYNNQNSIKNNLSITKNHKSPSLKSNNIINNNNYLRRCSAPLMKNNSKMKITQNIHDESENSEIEIEQYYEYYRILEIQKNEHFGDILMFLNKRSPLRVKVKSRKADLFYLKKNDAINISASFPHIWKKINKKSLFNWQQIKRLMTKILKIFHQFQGLNFDEDNIVDNKYIIDTSITENIDLQSIPSSFDMTLDEDEITQLKILNKNTQKNKLNTINESLSFGKTSSSNESDSTQKIMNDNYTIDAQNSSNYIMDNTLKLENEKNEINSIIEKKSLKINEKNFKKEDSYNNDDNKDNNDKNKNELTEYYEESSNLVSCNSLVITPYKPNEINNEIYPNEDKIPTSFKSNYKLDYNLLGLKLRKDDDYSICSTEISFSIESEYENINEISNYKYSKNNLMQRQCKNWIINFDIDDSKTKSILKPTNIKNKYSTSSVKFMNKDLKRKSFINSKISKKIQYNIKHRKSKFKKTNISNNENNGNSIISIPNEKKNKKNNLLNVIDQNIERNYINLNDPNLFYSEFFQKIIENNKIKDDIYLDSEDEIIKIFEKEIIDEKNHKCSFKKFKNIIKKL